MQEYSTRALVLDIEKVGERDGRVVLYTEELGKVVARAKSLYAINSKLAGHVQPLTLAQVRLVEKKGMQLVDALLERRLVDSATPTVQVIERLSIARLIEELTAAGHADEELWEVIAHGELLSRKLLRVLGFDPEHAQCHRCQKQRPSHFLLREMVYVCTDCFVSYRNPALGVKLGF